MLHTSPHPIRPRRRLILAALLLLAACAPTPKPSIHWDDPSPQEPAQQSAPLPPAEIDGQRQLIVDGANKQLGASYRYGGTGRGGFDCSGLVQVVYASSGMQLPRTCADQAAVGNSIPLEDALPGDLVFFGAGSRPTHVGIYVGHGRFVHASSGRGVVRTDTLDEGYFNSSFLGARQLLAP